MPPKHVHRVRKQKAKARLGTSQPALASDTNTAEILPTEQEARKAQLRAELRAQQSAPKISSKKAKRLDHYIDTKLKKEENAELIKKLSANKVDTSLLRSAKNLGRGADTKRETLSRALAETSRGINQRRNATLLYEPRPDASFHDLADAQSEESADEDEDEQDVTTTTAKTGPASSVTGFGSGLKRPLEVSENGLPQIKKRKRRKLQVESAFLKAPPIAAKAAEEDAGSDGDDDEEWGGFSDIPSDDDDEEEDEGDEEEHGKENGDGSKLSSDAEGDEEDDEDEEDSSSDSSPEGANGARSSVFKMWAEQKRNEALGFTPTTVDMVAKVVAPSSHGLAPHKNVPVINAPALGRLEEPLPGARAVSITIKRPEEIQEARLKLPVVQEEQRIMETIHANTITIVCGATGSGKTTQVPQMMFESGYGSSIGSTTPSDDKRAKGMIGVTQPRRVAATSVAARVATEMGELHRRVGHQVRFDSAVGASTAIKFMTDGILLREISNDFLLERYSAIVIDEAHERSVNTDILIGLLSRIVDLRADLAREKPEKHYPLKLVIMSATMRVQDFTSNDKLFRNGPPPIVQAEGRQYSVVNHFARETHRDYMEEMYKKVVRGHRKLPRGAMLVFLTGQAEIVTMVKRLRQALSKNGGNIDDEDEIHGLSDEEDDEFAVEAEEGDEQSQKDSGPQAVHILPLYSALPSAEQAKVFAPPPEGSRLIVLATNVAETSITIPGVRYVFDCGRAKEKQYNTSTGVQTFEVGWISKASALQRAGRAGRTGPGHCYKLYSSAVYERDFEEYTIPEILRTPLENVALMIKGVDFPNVANFPFPTAPDRHALARAEQLLGHLSAIDARGKITEVGKQLINYPVNPRYGRMLLLASSNNLLPQTIAMVAALAIPELLLNRNQVLHKVGDYKVDEDEDTDEESRNKQNHFESMRDEEQKLKAFNEAQEKLSARDDRCDAMKRFVGFVTASKPGRLHSRCQELFIREKAMQEAIDLRAQLVRIVQTQHPTVAADDLLTIPLFKGDQQAKLKYILAAGFSDQLAIRADLIPGAAAPDRVPQRAIHVPYRTLLPSSIATPGVAADKNVFVHPSSVLARLDPAAMPPFVVYEHLSRAAARTVGSGADGPSVRMHPLSTVGAKQVVALLDGTSLLEVGKPIGKITALPRGEDGRERREVWVGLGVNADGARWDLGTRKERQVRRGLDWVTETVIG